MKIHFLLKAIAASGAFGLAAQMAAAQSQSDNQSSVTRSEVRNDLRRVEQAGYDPSANDPHYPRNIQAAERRADGQDQSPAPQTRSASPSDYH